MNLFLVACAYVLDLIFGDPRRFPHPVKGIGFLIKKFERLLYKDSKLAGCLLVVIVVGVSFGMSWGVVKICYMINIWIAVAISIGIIYTTLSIKDLKVESMQVYYALKRDDIVGARKNLSMIVGRDTYNLNREEIIRATVETIAENTVDGIISPMFYAFWGGAPLAIAYKAVSTLDSMIGYKTSKYMKFGWVAARLDDVLNFIPARISILIMPIASLLIGKSGVNSFKIAIRDGNKSSSPNAGIPEAAVAGALGIRLGGPVLYGGKEVNKPYIGDGKNELELVCITSALEISLITSFLTLIGGIIFALYIWMRYIGKYPF